MDVKIARKLLNLSQEQFAIKLKVSTRTIGYWEKGEVAVPPAKIEEINNLVAEARSYGDVIKVGNSSPGAGKNNVVNTDGALLRAFEEIAAQRKLTENALAELSKSQQQVSELLGLLKLKMVNP